MWKQSVWTSTISSHLAALHLKPGGLLTLAGAKAALSGTGGKPFAPVDRRRPDGLADSALSCGIRAGVWPGQRRLWRPDVAVVRPVDSNDGGNRKSGGAQLRGSTVISWRRRDERPVDKIDLTNSRGDSRRARRTPVPAVRFIPPPSKAPGLNLKEAP